MHPYKTTPFLFFFALLIGIHSYSFAQQRKANNIVELNFNHLYFVIDSTALNAINSSDFVTNELVVLENRTTEANGQTWTGTYMYGDENYIEFFDSAGLSGIYGVVPEGVGGIAFSVNKVGDLNMLRSQLEKTYTLDTFTRKRNYGKKIIPWFKSLSVKDSIFNSKTLLTSWVMEYKKEYYDHNGFIHQNDSLLRKNYLLDFEEKRKNKIVKRFSGVTLTLNQIEAQFYKKWFKSVGYVETRPNEYVSPEGFLVSIKARKPNNSMVIESISFDTSKPTKDQTRYFGKNISVEIKNNKGVFRFLQN
nr:DUF5829 family protein [uncultured Allomuricauda sp.]